MATNYLGAKSASGAYQAIIGSMPPHIEFIDAFCGSGSVIRNHPSICSGHFKFTAIDSDGEVFKRFKYPKTVQLIKADAIAWLENYIFDDPKVTLVYCDPPYLPMKRTSNKQYRHEMTVRDHIRLLRVLKKLPCSVILSGYPSRLYDEELDGWRTREFQVMTRGGPRTEKLWMNFGLVASMLSKFVGKNFSDRRRIKRKAARWAAKFKALPASERQVVHAALLDVMRDESEEATISRMIRRDHARGNGQD